MLRYDRIREQEALTEAMVNEGRHSDRPRHPAGSTIQGRPKTSSCSRQMVAGYQTPAGAEMATGRDGGSAVPEPPGGSGTAIQETAGGMRP